MGLQSPAPIQGGEKKRFLRKRADPFSIIARIKLWPSRKGILHGVRSIKRDGNVMTVITHCNQKTRVRCSKNGRVARWIRNKWYEKACKECRVPRWKLQKYSQTSFIKGNKEKKYARHSRVFGHAETTTS